MEDRKEKNAPWLSVPQFGDWDQKGQLPDYSLDFSKIREMRKQNKREVSRASLGNEEEFSNPTATSVSTAPSDDHHDYPQNHHSPTWSRDIECLWGLKDKEEFLQLLQLLRQGLRIVDITMDDFKATCDDDVLQEHSLFIDEGDGPMPSIPP
ncbi:hypothetical protein DITRI_Ditri16bG0071800 [Diplodiscus trichospermus]